jgi:uncharacterized protein
MVLSFTLGAALAALPCAAIAAGFDCAKAATQTEKAICADQALSELDEKLAAAFRSALASASDKDAVKNAQKAWLKRRNACADAACLRQAYDARLDELGKKSAPDADQDLKDALAKRETWRERLKWPDDCEEEFKESAGPGAFPGEAAGVDIYSLSASERLAVVQCGLYAYQISFVALLFDAAGSEPGRLVTFKEYGRETSGKVSSDETTEMAGEPVFHERGKTLTVFSKSRGVGDCGSFVTYGFESGRLVVREARAQACFDDTRKWIDPVKWPKVDNP